MSEEKTSGIAVLPSTDERPIAIVGMGSSDKELAEVKLLSDRLTEMGMTHVLLSLEDAEKEGISKDDLVKAQLSQTQSDGLLAPNPMFNGGSFSTSNGTFKKRKSGSKIQQKFKRKKKGKKTHRKKK